MPRLAAPLTELQIRKAKPKDQAYFLSDGNGLVLWISPVGLKSWRVRYRLADGSRPAPATIGHYPEMSLAEERIKAVEVQRNAKQGKSTAGVRKVRQEAAVADGVEQETIAQAKAEIEHASFRAVSGRWMAEKRPTWATETYRKARLVVDSYLVPKLGDQDMRKLETKDVRPVLVEMAKDTPQLARKARQYLGSIVDHAINDGLRSDESRLRLDRILPKYRSGHMPAVTDNDSKLGEVMEAIHAYPNRVVRAALILAALTAMRSGVVASARWEEIDLEAAEWRIPGMNPDGTNRMKTGQDFSTSLPEQALVVLREMYERRVDGEYVFPPQGRQHSPHLSRDTLSKALREMGFQGEHTTHGFRASLRTLGRERLGIDVDVLEAQLAHAPKDEVEAAYARVKFRAKRREVMQQWADYLDQLRVCDALHSVR
ncbi:integrase [Luteibacter sp. Sphag1AF]|uniref:tyrosine-type recombinase/integrase n=1 Tax=Luteibacter sp. Sphag1AF TaxID=2587031 RepID=UPI0016108988|nr:integrase arm-type DNA-binding domain-containing protein [Luteibacter sp. Sphag1AF]MBB3228774.1 integrase [Luteibacter sp. Sphag1AF]